MLIDVRRKLFLGVPEEQATIVVPTQKRTPDSSFSSHGLTLRGVPVFGLNPGCGTCPALFTKMTDPETADLGLANQRLNSGLAAIDDDVLRVYGQVLPESEYTVLLLEVTPRFVEPGDASDYFSHEQVTTWGIDSFVGAPENPGTPYYRTFEARVGRDEHLYEFVVPMVPPEWNDPDRVEQYSAAAQGESATAVAYSLLSLMQPATSGGEDYYEHWLLTHFLLDGHHKLEAAARSGRPLRLLCFLDERASMAAGRDVATLVKILSKSSAARRVRR